MTTTHPEPRGIDPTTLTETDVGRAVSALATWLLNNRRFRFTNRNPSFRTIDT